MSAAKTPTIKKYLSDVNGVVWYNDPIQAGRSLKIVYEAGRFQEAINAYDGLKAKFPKNRVRLLNPVEGTRRGWSVRIWAQE